MKFRTKLIVLSAILLVLVMTYISGSIFSRERALGSTVNRELLNAFDVSVVESLRLLPQTEGKKDVLLSRNSENDWSIEIGGRMYPANIDQVTNLLNALENALVIREITEKKELWENFSLGQEQAGQLIVRGPDSEALYHLFLGDAGIKGDEQYLRLGEDPTVLLTGTSFSYYLDRDHAFWSELALFPESLNGETVNRVIVDAPATEEEDEVLGQGLDYILYRMPGAGAANWQMLGRENEPLDQQRTDGFVRQLVSLKADRFVLPEERKNNIGELILNLTITGDRAKEYGLEVYDTAEDKLFYLRPEGPEIPLAPDSETYTYEVKEYKKEQIVVVAEDLIAQEAEAEEESEAE